MRSNLLPNGSGILSHAAYPAGATLLPAPAGAFMPGERRGGWTFRGNGGPAAVTLGNAANKPSGYLSDGLKFGAGSRGRRRIIVGGYRLCKADLANANPHIGGSSLSLRSWQIEDGRDTGVRRCRFQTIRMSKRLER